MKHLTIVLLLILFQTSFAIINVDSLKNQLRLASEDTLKVQTLIRLWEATAYTTTTGEADEYAWEALRLSQKLNYKEGIAEAYHRIAIIYNNSGEIDSSEFYYNKTLDLARELKKVRLEANTLMDIGILYYSQGIYGKAMIYAEESLKKLSEADDEQGIAQVIGLLGNINFYSGNFAEAQKYHLQSVQILEKGNDRARTADAMVYLASVYQALSKYDKALENLYKARIIYEDINDQYYLSQALNNTGYIHNRMGATDSAMIYYDLAMQKALLSKNNTTLNLVYNNFGSVMKAQNKLDKSLDYFRKSLALAEKHNDQILIASAYSNMGEIYSLQGDYSNAQLNFNLGLKLAREIGAKDNLRTIYLGLSEMYTNMGNFAKALDYYKEFDYIKDTMFNEDKTRKIEEMEARYEKEKKEKEIALQKTEIELLSKDLEIQTVKRDGLFIGMILSILAGIYLVVSLRQKMKRNKVIREQEKKLEEEKLHIAQLERDNYEKELAYKKNELTSHALQMIQKNELLETLKSQIAEFETASPDDRHNYRRLRHTINGSAQTDKEWENFNKHFEQVHQGFYSTLKTKHNSLSSNDLRLSAMLRLNLSSKEVATIMNVTPESVKKARYRLRKKLQLDNEADLHSYMMNVN